MIPFAEWTPDVADVGSGGTTIASGVQPASNGYLPWKQPIVYSNALPELPYGAVMAFLTDGSRRMYAADGTKLYKLNATTLDWDDQSRVAGGAYNLVFGDRVDFAQFGKTLMATNVNDVVQSIDIDSGTNFAALAGSPPMAKYIEIVGDFVMLGSIASYPQRVVWSAINDSTGWTAGTNQSDFQDFPEGGHIQGIIGGQGGLIFQEEVIRRMTYVGPPVIFQFDKVADRGLLAPFSLVRIGDVAYGLSRDGFISVSMGGQMGMIGKEKIDRWFFNDASAGEIRTVKGVADRFQTKIYWSYKSNISPYDSILCFDYSLNRWSYCRLVHSEIITAATQGYTLEGLDALGFTLDELPASLDDPMWQGGAPLTAILDADYKLAFFSGSNMEAIIESAEAELFPGRRAFVQGIRPIVDCATAAVKIGHRTLPSSAVTYSNEKTTEAITGNAWFDDVDNRYVRARVRIPAGTEWTKALGIDATAVPSGQV